MTWLTWDLIAAFCLGASFAFAFEAVLRKLERRLEDID